MTIHFHIPRWVLWGIGLFILIIAICKSNPFTWDTPLKARRSKCQEQLRRIALACQQYQQDADDHLPPVSQSDKLGWADLLVPYYKATDYKPRALFQCPVGDATVWERTSDYFYNAHLAGSSDVKAPEKVVLFGDGPDNSGTDSHFSALPVGWDSPPPSDYDWHQDRLPMRRHLSGANYAFADGHVKWFLPQKIHTLRDTGGW